MPGRRIVGFGVGCSNGIACKDCDSGGGDDRNGGDGGNGDGEREERRGWDAARGVTVAAGA